VLMLRGALPCEHSGHQYDREHVVLLTNVGRNGIRGTAEL
jgi:hypothetical protein